MNVNKLGISHDIRDSGIIARAREFQQLTIQERLDTLREFTELALALNPDLPKRRRASQLPGSSEILSLPRS